MACTVRPLKPALREFALRDCNEDPAARASCIESLQTWIQNSPHLRARTCNQLLVAFLRRCRYSLEETKKRIESFYALRSLFPEVLRSRALTDQLLALHAQGVHIVPSQPLQSDGPRVIVSQYARYNWKTTSPGEVFKLLFMIVELLAIEDDHASVSGLAYVIDARDVGMDQLRQFDPHLMRKTWTLVEHCLPARFTEVHLINMRREGQAVFNFVTSFLPSKLPMKFLVHTKAEALYEHIPRDAMPIEYGGHNGYLAEALEATELRLRAYKDYFAEDDCYGCSDKARLGICSNWEVSELSGLSGSFCKLGVD